MKILFHGAAGEVGKSCIEIQSRGQQYLLDAGVKFIQGGIAYPDIFEDIRKVDALFLSHAHMDHSGALPFFEHYKLNCPIYTTPMTWKIVHMLLEDAYHIAQMQGAHPAYQKRDIRRTARDAKMIEYDRDYRTPDGSVKFRYLNSGHIPGGASILLELEGKRILYTADMNSEETKLMKPSIVVQQMKELTKKWNKPLDALIIEATYGNREHPNRIKTQEKFLKAIHRARERGGIVLIPSFGVGRAQEILLMLEDLPGHIPIYLDGMARKVTKLVINEDDQYTRGKKTLTHMMNHVTEVSRHMRSEIVKERGAVIVSTSGMIQGGPSVFYTEKIYNDPKSSIILTGYQVEGTRGRSLWEDHIFYRHGEALPIKCTVEKYDFSAHYGQSAIHQLIEEVPHRHLILQHGSSYALEAVKKYAKEHLTSTIHVPHVGSEIEI